jgi:hypothetical protein
MQSQHGVDDVLRIPHADGPLRAANHAMLSDLFSLDSAEVMSFVVGFVVVPEMFWFETSAQTNSSESI